MLYKSYQARGYLHFLGTEAKQGTLKEEDLPLDGWPKKRIRHWRKNAWSCPWLERAGDILEPYLFLPALIVSAWVTALLLRWVPLSPWIVLGVAIFLASFILSVFCIFCVWYWQKDEEDRDPPHLK